jgi:phosphohistidine phosphatase
MKLFLLRHGQAAKTSPDGPRPLTPHGKAEVSSVGEYFKKNKIRIGEVWHSPKTRAIETAEIFLEASENFDAIQEQKDGLIPEGDVEGTLRDLETFKGPSLIIVTHLPFVAELACGLDPEKNGSEMTFPTAGVAAFERKNNGWKWLWSLDPSKLA